MRVACAVCASGTHLGLQLRSEVRLRACAGAGRRAQGAGRGARGAGRGARGAEALSSPPAPRSLREPPPGTSKKGRTFNDTSEFPRYFRSKRYDTSDWAIPSLEGSLIGFLKVRYLRIGLVPLKTCFAGMLCDDVTPSLSNSICSLGTPPQRERETVAGSPRRAPPAAPADRACRTHLTRDAPSARTEDGFGTPAPRRGRRNGREALSGHAPKPAASGRYHKGYYFIVSFGIIMPSTSSFTQGIKCPPTARRRASSRHARCGTGRQVAGGRPGGGRAT
jgi:hypothetical protein